MTTQSLASAHFTPSQLSFLRVRPDLPSDAEAARRVGVTSFTVSKWKKISPHFAAEYKRIMSEVSTAVESFDADTYIERRLVPMAAKRMEEILASPVTENSTAADKAVTRNVAKDVLEGRGYLGVAPENPLRIDVLIGEFIQQKLEYRPAWLDAIPKPMPHPKK